MRKRATKWHGAWRKWLIRRGICGLALAILGLGSVGCSPEDVAQAAASASDDKSDMRAFVIQPDPDSFIGRLPGWPL